MVFIHGSGATHRVWRYQTAAFPSSLAIDLPGHPQGRGQNTVQGYADSVIRIVRKNQLEPVVLVGHSLGGAIAIEIALTEPALSAGIVLVGSGARLRVTPMIMTEVLNDYQHVAEVITEWAYSPKTEARLRRASLLELLEVPAEVTYGDFEACDHFDRMNEIEDITVPTLIVCGEDDRLTPVKYSRYLKDKIRNAKLVIVPDAGHSIMLEKPEELNAALQSFLVGLQDRMPKRRKSLVER